MAEVYRRCHNNLEGLVALTCTLAADSKGDSEQIWQEMVALARLLRDCGLFGKARIASRYSAFGASFWVPVRARGHPPAWTAIREPP